MATVTVSASGGAATSTEPCTCCAHCPTGAQLLECPNRTFTVSGADWRPGNGPGVDPAILNGSYTLGPGSGLGPFSDVFNKVTDTGTWTIQVTAICVDVEGVPYWVVTFTITGSASYPSIHATSIVPANGCPNTGVYADNGNGNCTGTVVAS